MAHGTTKGWTIGSKAIGKVSVPDVGEVSVEVSAPYKDESTDTTTETTTTEYDAQCPGQTYCTIATVTFSYKVTGTCWRETWYDFMEQNQPAKLCSTGPFDTCYNMAALYYNGCSMATTAPIRYLAKSLYKFGMMQAIYSSLWLHPSPSFKPPQT